MSVTRMRFAKTAERIDDLFEAEALWSPRHIALDGDLDPPRRVEGDSMQPSPGDFRRLFAFKVAWLCIKRNL